MNRNEVGQLIEKYPDSLFIQAVGGIGNASYGYEILNKNIKQTRKV